jgi:hypothetical protein
MRSLLVALAACAGCESAAPGQPAGPAQSHQPPPVLPADDRMGPSARPCDGSSAVLGDGITTERWRVTDDAASPCLDLVRIDLADHALSILAASREGGGARPAPKWADDFHLVAAINLAMFSDDGSPVALAVDARGAINPHDSKSYGGFLAFDPVDPHDAPAIVAGRSCKDFDLAALRRRYRAVVQSYRLLDCDGGAIAWKDPKRYSAAAVGVDRAGRLVLVHVRAPFTMKALSASLARPALGLAGAIFVEGGPEASVVVRAQYRLDLIGSYEDAFNPHDDNYRFWDLPNVLGVVAR